MAARHYDVLINNAGAGLYGRFAELPLDDQLRMMRLNMESVSVLSHAYLCQAKPGDALVNKGRSWRTHRSQGTPHTRRRKHSSRR